MKRRTWSRQLYWKMLGHCSLCAQNLHQQLSVRRVAEGGQTSDIHSGAVLIHHLQIPSLNAHCEANPYTADCTLMASILYGVVLCTHLLPLSPELLLRHYALRSGTALSWSQSLSRY